MAKQYKITAPYEILPDEIIQMRPGEPDMALGRYLLGYRTVPLLKITPGMGGTHSRGIRDFVRFLLGYRGYIRVNVNEQEPS